MLFHKRNAAAILLSMVVTVPVCYANEAGAIHGTVRDARGSPVAGARIALVVNGTVAAEATSDPTGKYELPSVPLGRQTLSITPPRSAASFQVRCDVRSAKDQTCDVVMSPSDGNQLGVIGAATVRDLPVNGRDVSQAATLEAGVASVRTQQSATDAASGRGQRGFGQQISLSGARPQQNNYMLDGVTINDYANSAPGSVLGLELGADAVERIAVNTSSYPAQNGRSSGGVVHAVTRSGSDDFHGSVY